MMAPSRAHKSHPRFGFRKSLSTKEKMANIAYFPFKKVLLIFLPQVLQVLLGCLLLPGKFQNGFIFVI